MHGEYWNIAGSATLATLSWCTKHATQFSGLPHIWADIEKTRQEMPPQWFTDITKSFAWQWQQRLQKQQTCAQKENTPALIGVRVPTVEKVKSEACKLQVMLCGHCRYSWFGDNGNRFYAVSLTSSHLHIGRAPLVNFSYL